MVLPLRKVGQGTKREEKERQSREMEKETAVAKWKEMSSAKKPCSPPSPPPPPPPPQPSTPWATPRPRKAAATVKSVTRDEIDTFWRRKRMEEEDHLLAAQKAAARIRAKALKARTSLFLAKLKTVFSFSSSCCLLELLESNTQETIPSRLKQALIPI